MKNPFKYFKERKENRRRLRDNAAMAFAFGTFDKFAKGDLLWFDEKHRRLMIGRSLAVLMMKDAETWVHFLSMIGKWQYLKECQKAWDSFMQKEEMKAVREAMKKFASMSRTDIERVKESRRAEILQSDMKPPKVQGFEFFVIGPEMPAADATGTAAKDVTEPQSGENAIPGGKILLVGHFDPENPYNVEMATWEEVSLFLNSER